MATLVLDWTDTGVISNDQDATAAGQFALGSVSGSNRVMVVVAGAETGGGSEMYGEPSVVEVKDKDDDSIIATAGLIVSASRKDVDATLGSDRALNFAVFNEAAVAAIEANGGNHYIHHTLPEANTGVNGRGRLSIYSGVSFAAIESAFHTTASGTPTNLAIASVGGTAITGMLSSTQSATVTWSAPAARVSDLVAGVSNSADINVLREDVSAGTVNSLWSSDSTAFRPPHILMILPNASANTDPQLDTTIPDISITTATTGAVEDLSGHFSDVDLDTLTYGVTPALPSGLTLNTSSGVLSVTGALSVTAGANYTFSASDGQGGTDATDVVNIEITLATNPLLTDTLLDAENSNVAITNETSLHVTVYDSHGGTELYETSSATTDGSGVFTIDDDLVGAVGSTPFVVFERTNGQTACGTMTVVDGNA